MDDKITTKIKALRPDSYYFSLEFFPPKTQQGFSNLQARLSRMAYSLRPLFVNVTWGAGGSTSSKSLALAELTQRQLGLTTCLHLTCTNMSRKLIDEALEEAKAMGVRNILALRGDPPRSEEYRDDSDPVAREDDSNTEFTWAVDLVRYIRKQYGDFFCIGVAGYPEGHADQSHPESQSIEHDLPYLVEKTAAGADFIMTQLFYDVDAYQAYETCLRNHESGAFKTIPVVPGLMPIQSYQILRRTTKLSHASFPAPLLKRLDAVRGDDEAVKRVGVEILSDIIDSMKSSRTPGPKGFHFYTLNLEKVVAQIIERCALVPEDILQKLSNDKLNGRETVLEDESDGFLIVPKNIETQNDLEPFAIDPKPLDLNPKVDPDKNGIGVRRDDITSSAKTLSISEGDGVLGREATWDDYPNGRWGDARSPAYGEIDGYGISLHVSAIEARCLWGEPRTIDDISRNFRRHLEGEIDSVPWSEEPLQAETISIKKELLSLIDKGWFTIASQPAVNGKPSTDPVFGWGPKNGYVFQKPFVEFFLPTSDWARLRGTLDKHPQITYFAANAKGDFTSSDEGSINPVTWGTFTAKEIITPTIVEAVSFKAWAEEAFGIWAEWQRIYRPGSESSKLLEHVRKDYWLVNIIHHGFLEERALWDDLLEI